MGCTSSASSRGGGSAPELDKELIKRANAAGIMVDYGDAAQRAYAKRVQEISEMDMTSAERKAAYNELHSLTEAQLTAESKSLSPYSMGVGPARFDRDKMRQNADKAADARNRVELFMSGLRKQQSQKTKEKEQKAMTSAITKAQKSGSLEFTLNGKTYFRTSKNSGSWREGTVKEYKAQQKFNKEQKNIPFTKRKSWSSLTSAERARYYK